MKIAQTQDSGYTVYKFTANNTAYEVLTDDDQEYQVYSQRNGLKSTSTPKVYDSLTEMAKRSKALAGLAALIK